MNEEKPNPVRPEMPQEMALAAVPGLSRRELLRLIGGSAVLLTLSAAAEQQAHALPALWQAPGEGGPGRSLLTGTAGDILQLPFWGDGSQWDQPEYYETIQALHADIDGDGRDELIGRGPGGILVNRFDSATGQWLPMPAPQQNNGEGLWRDVDTWNRPQYYLTIQCADIDGDGQAELIGRGGRGIEIYKYDTTAQEWNTFPVPQDPNNQGNLWQDSFGWDQPQYYLTIQCADIDGDGQAELIGRGGQGIEIYKYALATQKWNTFPVPQDPNNQGNLWKDAFGWDRPEYYLTIQCADIDGDGQAELIGRGGRGIEIYKYNKKVRLWNTFPVPQDPNNQGNLWKDAFGWNLPQYFATIRCADIDGDGQAELIGRGGQGIEIYKYALATQKWNTFPVPQDPNNQGNLWKDAFGWDRPEYYLTIQCADIDGDGQAELIGRGGRGIEIYKYDKTARTWSHPPFLSAWSDDNGWNQVQFYTTIQGSYVIKPGDAGYIGDGIHTQALIVGRGSQGMQTYRYTAPGWTQTSAPLPQFTVSQHTAYQQLDKALGVNARGNIRAVYNDIAGDFTHWTEAMYSSPPPYDTPPSRRPHTLLSRPAHVSRGDWDAVTWQIYWEMRWVMLVQKWFNDIQGRLIVESALGKFFTLDAVADKAQFPPDSSLTILFDILAFLAAAAAVVATAGGAGPVVAGLCGFLGVIYREVGAHIPSGGNAFQATFKELENELADTFAKTILANGAIQTRILGGKDSNGNYVPGDYGLLRAIGQLIADTTWSWPTDMEGHLVLSMERAYAIYCWKRLLTAQPWHAWQVRQLFFGLPSDYPRQYLYSGASGVEWVLNLWPHVQSLTPKEAMAALFDPIQEGSPFPLGVPLSEVFEGQRGWPKTEYTNQPGSSLSSPNPIPAPTPSLGVDMRLSVALTRGNISGEVMATITLNNQGMSPATNVEITGATLSGRQALANHAYHPTRVLIGYPVPVALRFASLPKGTTALLRVTGSYLGGTFGGSFRVTLP